MTPEQIEEAKALYIQSKISNHDKDVHNQITILREEIAQRVEQLTVYQNQYCSHPLIARDHKNEGYSGNYDRDEDYWTNHNCLLCGLRWTTHQRWAYVGDKQGHPSDEKARC